jgi:hypothetical protein
MQRISYFAVFLSVNCSGGGAECPGKRGAQCHGKSPTMAFGAVESNPNQTFPTKANGTSNQIHRFGAAPSAMMVGGHERMALNGARLDAVLWREGDIVLRAIPDRYTGIEERK